MLTLATQLEREIRGQGDVVRRRAAAGAPACAAAARTIARAGQLVVAGRGSSGHAARFAQYLLGREARLLVTRAAPSLYRDRDAAPRLGGAAALAISQSGQSPDVVSVLMAARAQGSATIALTNDPESPLAAAADIVVPLLAGPERSVAATGTYTAALVALAQIADALAPGRARSLDRLARALDALTDAELAGRARYDALAAHPALTVVGHGLHHATAHETALKLRELSGSAAEAYSPADLLHGPIAAVGRRTAVWIVRPGVPAGLVARLRDRAGLLLSVDDAAPGWTAAVLAVVPGQVAGLRLAELRGIDPDAPPGLEKVTCT